MKSFKEYIKETDTPPTTSPVDGGEPPTTTTDRSPYGLNFWHRLLIILGPDHPIFQDAGFSRHRYRLT